MADWLVQAPLKWLAAEVESKYRQELVRSVTVDNYRLKVSEPFTNWTALEGKRSLLVVHGIFSTTHGVLSQYPRTEMEELVRRYEGRVIALDQLTVTRSPQENAQTLINALPPTGKFEFDILCHSRGGIVARTLAEQHVSRPDCLFPRVFFVATPNAGSVLADAEHIMDMIDVFTNLLTSFPDGPVMYSIEIILGLIKLVALTAERHLPGLAAMSTTGYIATELNRATEPSMARYAAAASNYEPDPRGDNSFFTGRIGNAIIDRVFRSGSRAVANDLVVPFEGVFASNGHKSFPITDTVRFAPADHVWHTGFFAQPRAQEAIRKHLQIPEVPAVRGGAQRGPASGPTRRFRGGAGAGVAPTPRPPAALTAARELRRSPEMDFPEQVVAGHKYPLIVRLAALTNGATTALSFRLDPGETEANVLVVLRAPGFDITGEDNQAMTLGEVPDPAREKVTFELTPRPAGTAAKQREIWAEFWYRNACIGSVSRFTLVASAEWLDIMAAENAAAAVQNAAIA
jgi:hypothetical protein